VITNEKKVLPCCTFWGEKMPLGRIDTPEDLVKYWNSEEMTQLRNLHLSGNFQSNEICKMCVGG